MPDIDFGQANQTALADYFIERFNLVGRDAEYAKNRPTLMAIPRDTKKLAMGNFFDETLKVAGGWTGSPDWQAGNANYNPSQPVKWRVGDPYAQYGRLTFDSLLLARTPMGTLLDLKSSEADDVQSSMLDTLEFELWNDGTGARGQVTSGGGSGTTLTLTLSNPGDVYNFPIGAVLTSNTARDGSGTAHTNVYAVIDLDPVGGTITVTKTTDNTSPIANNDYLHAIGSAGKYMPGIPTFIPASAPSDTLFGVTRTGNPALSGWRFGFKASIGETIQRAFATMGRWVNRGAKKFVGVLSTTDWLLLSLEKGDGRVFEDNTALATWGVEGLVVRTPFGPITVISIPQVPDGRGYILDFSTWRLYSLKNLPHVIDEDGLTFIRGQIGAPDGYLNGDLLAMQFRIWKVLLCLQPMSNATFPTA